MRMCLLLNITTFAFFNVRILHITFAATFAFSKFRILYVATFAFYYHPSYYRSRNFKSIFYNNGKEANGSILTEDI